MRQIQKWVVTTQNMRRKGRPYSYTAIAARDSYVRYAMGFNRFWIIFDLFKFNLKICANKHLMNAGKVLVTKLTRQHY